VVLELYVTNIFFAFGKSDFLLEVAMVFVEFRLIDFGVTYGLM